MSSRTDADLLNDMREAIGRVREYLGDSTYEIFLHDFKTQDAVIRNLEIIGEATKNLSEALRAKHPHIPWRGMAGLRDRLIHQYFGVNIDIVWEVASSELPEVATALAKIAD